MACATASGVATSSTSAPSRDAVSQDESKVTLTARRRIRVPIMLSLLRVRRTRRSSCRDAARRPESGKGTVVDAAERDLRREGAEQGEEHVPLRVPHVALGAQ